MPLILRNYLHDDILDAVRESRFGGFYEIDSCTIGVRLDDGSRVRVHIHQAGRESPRERIPYTETHLVVDPSSCAATVALVEQAIEDGLQASFSSSLGRLTRSESCGC